MTDNSSATLSVYGKSSLDTVVKIILDIELPDLRLSLTLYNYTYTQLKHIVLFLQMLYND